MPEFFVVRFIDDPSWEHPRFRRVGEPYASYELAAAAAAALGDDCDARRAEPLLLFKTTDAEYIAKLDSVDFLTPGEIGMAKMFIRRSSVKREAWNRWCARTCTTGQLVSSEEACDDALAKPARRRAPPAWW